MKLSHFFYTIYLIACSNLYAQGSNNILLQPPECISASELQSENKIWAATFDSSSSTIAVRFLYYNGDVAMKLINHANGEKIIRKTLAWDKLCSSIRKTLPLTEQAHNPYHIHTPRIIIEKVCPKECCVKEIATDLRAKEYKVVFYTGAGISMASGVENMEQLKAGLQIPKEGPVSQAYMTHAFAHNDAILGYLKKFCDTAFTAPATQAHQALKKLSAFKSSQIMTENFDFLQHKTGIKPYGVSAHLLAKEVNPIHLKEIHAIITIGLSHDDRGFLGWYKHHNPAGRIIAFNRAIPNYLGPEDSIVLGDAQETIPELSTLVDFQ